MSYRFGEPIAYENLSIISESSFSSVGSIDVPPTVL